MYKQEFTELFLSANKENRSKCMMTDSDLEDFDFNYGNGLIIDDNTIYEVDLNCYKCLQEEKRRMRMWK